MSEIDLVPPRYRRRKTALRWALRAGVVYAALALGLLGARATLSERVEGEQSRVDRLQQRRAQAEQARVRVEQLESERAQLAQQLALLDGLRAGPPAKNVFVAIDAALDEEVWFQHWTFQRAGEVVDDGAQIGAPGYFIVLPREAEAEPQRAWRVATHMEIRGEASDHSALARFVRRLSEQRAIEGARILSTQVQPRGDVERVQFELAVVVRSAQ
jgi:Tfp pilus assembly protein PilN